MSINNRKNSLYNPKFKHDKNNTIQKEEVKSNEVVKKVEEEINQEEVIENIEKQEVKNDEIEKQTNEEIKQEQLNESINETQEVDIDEMQEIEKEIQVISEKIDSGEIVIEGINGEVSNESETFTDEQISELQSAMSETEKEKTNSQKKQEDDIVKKTIPHYNIAKNPLTNSIEVVSPKKIKNEGVVKMSKEKNDIVKTMLEQASSDVVKMEIEIEVHKNLIALEHLHTSRNELQNKLNTLMRNHEYLVKRKEQLILMLDNSSQ
jgi:hypothetical protein